MEIINICRDIWNLLSSGMSSVYTFFSTPLGTLIEGVDIFIVSDILSFAVNTLGIGYNSILEIMFTVGLSTVIIITLAKWFIGVFRD